MESFQKRERDRKKRQKRQDKAARRKDRSESKKQVGHDEPMASSEVAPNPPEDATQPARPVEGVPG